MKRKLSDNTVKLIDSLYAQRGLVRSLVRPEQAEGLIREIAESRESAAIPDLLPILITGNTRLRSACAEAVYRLVQELKPAEFVRFDEYVRQGYSDWCVRCEPWYSIKPKDIALLVNWGEISVAVLGIASCHTNGHVREVALRELGKSDTGAELPFLLLRANDWVDVIRSSARALLSNRIRTDYLPHLLRWLPLILRLGKVGRSDHTEIIGSVRQVFESPAASGTLRSGFSSQDLFVARFCYERALNIDSANCLDVFQRAFHQRDPQIRLLAVRKLGALLPSAEWKEVLIKARNDAYMPVRREALHVYSNKYPAQADAEFQSALLDSNVAIREEAQYFFRKKGALDLREFYLQALATSSGARLCAALSGLGETGAPQDAARLTGFISVASAKLRAACLRALAKLRQADHLEQCHLALADPSGKVVEEARRVLTRKAGSLSGQRLWEIYTGSPYPHGRQAALFLIARINKWDSITFLIQSLAEGEPFLSSLSHRYISRWFARYNRTFPAPSAEQLARLRITLERYKFLISPGVHSAISSLIQNF